MTQSSTDYPSWAPTATAPQTLSLSETTEGVLHAARALMEAIGPFAKAMEELAEALVTHDSSLGSPAPAGYDPTRRGLPKDAA